MILRRMSVGINGADGWLRLRRGKPLPAKNEALLNHCGKSRINTYNYREMTSTPAYEATNKNHELMRDCKFPNLQKILLIAPIVPTANSFHDDASWPVTPAVSQ